MNCRRITAWAGAAAFFCVAGAQAQTSLDVTLLSQQNLHGTYASCWGWTSPGGSEFAILGAALGTAIVDVTVPTAPVEKAFIPGLSSSWREMKSYSHYAYIVTEADGGGMQIVDLATNPPSLVATYTTTFSRAHTITIVGNFAYVSGARQGAAQVGIRFLDLTNPVAPVDVGGWNGFYTHDCQVRGNTLYAACISNGLLAIVDITNKAAPSVISTFTWPGNSAHNCDLTTDGKYLLTTDEVAGGDLHIFDVSNPASPVPVTTWTANPGAIIHNVHILGNLAYIAYYTEGMRVVDITNPAAPVEVGYYDTWPGLSGGFNGCWEAYPYAASGNVYLSDISTGLYVVRFTATHGSASGTVRVTGGGPVIAGATARFVGSTPTTSNAAGYFRAFGLPGSQRLVTTAFGFEPDSADVALSVGLDTPHDVDLVRLPSLPVTGTVRDASTLALLDGAAVEITGTPLLATTNGSGAYDLPFVPYGVYTLRASRFGYTPRTQSLLVAETDPIFPYTRDFELQPAAVAHDFESGAQGWTRVNPPVNATSGLWVCVDPIGSGGGAVQPEDDHSPAPGHLCWVTGNAATASSPVGDADVDNGGTQILSPAFDLSAVSNPVISYWRWYSNNSGSSPGSDTLRVQISNNNGSTWKYVERIVQSAASWVNVTVPVADYVTPTATMRVRFTAEDVGGGSVVEAAMDDFTAYGAPNLATDVAPARAVTRLVGAVPNPFNPSTRIRFEMGRPGLAELTIYDVRGRVLRTLATGLLAAGLHDRIWDGRAQDGTHLASGAYIVRLRAGDFEASQRILLVK